MTSSDSPPIAPASLPPELKNAFLFAGFNALSFQIVLGSPMVLYAKQLGASATVLGLIVGMLPLLVILQIPAARFVGRFGYKRFVLSGWSIRTTFVVLIALIPLSGTLITAEVKVMLVLGLLFLYNAARGIASCGWLPWISSIIPAHHRGRYLTRETAMVNLASMGAILLAAAVLGASPRPGHFAAMFFVSALAGALSLAFLKRIPEESNRDSLLNSVTPVPLKEMLGLASFRRLLALNLAWGAASGGIYAFSVAYLKGMSSMPENKILILNSSVFLGGLATLWFLGRLLDSVGSKPMILGAGALWLVIMALWTLVAGGTLPTSSAIIFSLMFLMGLGSSMMNLANTRLAMAVIPERGRSHFFVVFSVVGNVILGLAPILWGILIDSLIHTKFVWRAIEWNRYSLAFAGIGLVFAMMLIASFRLIEPEAARLEAMFRDVLTKSRFRYWIRLWPRG